MTIEKARVMVVEDENITARDIQGRLEKYGYTVCATVASGEQAVTKAAEAHPELVLMDIKLKGKIDGIEAAREIRSHLDIPIIYLTAYADDDLLARAKVTEPHGYILKPFQERELRAAIEMALYTCDRERKLRDLERTRRREVEKRFHDLFQNMKEGVCLHEVIYDEAGKAVDYRILDVNSAYEAITGLKRKKALDRKASDLYGAGEPPYLEIYAKVAATGEPTSFETYFSPMDKHFSISVFSPAKGQFATVFTDITERKRAEKAWRESEERYRTLFDRSLELVYLHDFEGNFIDANPAALSLLGYKRKDIASLNFASLLSEDQIPKALEALEELKETGTQKEPTEFRLRRKNGEYVDVEAMASVIYHEKKPYVIQGIARDITERKRREKEYRLIVQTSMDGFWIVDTRGRFLDVNDAYCDLIGYSRDELLGMSIQDIEVAEVPQETAQHIRHVMDVGYDCFETRHRCKDGNIVDVEVSVNHMKMGDGHFFVFLRDITKRKQMETKILRQNAILEAINQVFREGVVCETEEQLAKTSLGIAEELTGSKFGFLGELNQAGLFDTIAISNPGWDECKMPGSEVTMLIKNMEIRGIDRSLLREEKSRIVNEPSSHPDRVGTPEGHPPITCFLGVPLKQAGKTIGMIGLANKEGSYDQADQEAVELLSVAVVQALMRKRSELRVRRLYSLQNAIGEINQELVRGKSETELFQRACNALVGVDDIKFAWIGLVQEDSFEIKPEAHAGFEEGYLSAIKVTWDDSEYGKGPTGMAIKTGQPFIITNIETDRGYDPWWGEAVKRGFMSRIALPLVHDADVIGALNVYSERENAFGDEEVEFLIEVAGDIAVGVKSLRLEKQFQQSVADLRKMLDSTAEAMALLSEARDPYTAGHQRRMAKLTCAIAREMDLSEEQIERLRITGLIHDIGKMSVPVDILNKPGKLNELEFGIVKAHPETAYNIVKGLEFPCPVAQSILQHHERLDGSGYPKGLSSEDIILEARILAVADVVEAMSSQRPYRPALGVGQALGEISRNEGILYDSRVVDACVRLFYEKGFKFE